MKVEQVCLFCGSDDCYEHRPDRTNLIICSNGHTFNRLKIDYEPDEMEEITVQVK